MKGTFNSILILFYEHILNELKYYCDRHYYEEVEGISIILCSSISFNSGVENIHLKKL